MPQTLLFPDPRPLVERLGSDFFRTAPECPGVYLMRDGGDAVLYVGKAKNLRKRLASYRVANPQRLAPRHLRLLRAVTRIELRPCNDEFSALESEASLLRTLRPVFNRAGTWPGPPRYLAWQLRRDSLALAVLESAEPGWHCYGPLGAKATTVRAALARLLWCALNPNAGVSGLPEGWFAGRLVRIASLSLVWLPAPDHVRLTSSIDDFLSGLGGSFCEWISEWTNGWTHPVDLAVREADLETITRFVASRDLKSQTAELAGL
jgi:predicted GIY-YIG superfamily endonuclease